MACQNCKSTTLGQINAKCSDLFFMQVQDKEGHELKFEGYVPRDMNIGGGDYMKFILCLDCGQVQGDWPVEP